MIFALFGSIDTLSIAAAIDALNRLISTNSQLYGSMFEVDTEILQIFNFIFYFFTPP